MCLFHKWSKWKQYEEDYAVTPIGILYPKEVRGRTYNKTDLRQKRECEKCGKIQDILVCKD